MKNNKMIKNIKKDVKKQIEADIRKSVTKQISKESKGDIKKLRKQILREIQEDMFGVSVEQVAKEVAREISGDKKPSNEGTLDYKGFKFDRSRMSSLVTGAPGASAETKKSYNSTPIDIRMIKNKNKRGGSGLKTQDDMYMAMLPTQGGNFTNSNGKETFPMGTPTVPSFNVNDFLGKFAKSQKPIISSKKEAEEPLSEERKEEINFFIGKLKEGVSGLKENERNIDYRKEGDDSYTFEFERKADFDLKFRLTLNMKTYRANIGIFEFNVDGFNFDKKFIDILDMVQVLDLVGFNLNSHIDEINGINTIDIEKVKTPTMIKKKTIRSNTKIKDIIDDEKIVKVLLNNDIANYGQLNRVEDLTALKGIGAKTADKINEYLKK